MIARIHDITLPLMWPSHVWNHTLGLAVISSSMGPFLTGSRRRLGFWCPASVCQHSASFLDQNPRLFSIGDVKTCSLIIRSRRYTLDSLKIPFSTKFNLFVVHWCQRGVNRGSGGTQDTLPWCPDRDDRFGVSYINIYLPSFCSSIRMQVAH